MIIKVAWVAVALLLASQAWLVVTIASRDEEKPAAPTTSEFTLSDGTRCVSIGDKALVCDFAEPGYWEEEDGVRP